MQYTLTEADVIEFNRMRAELKRLAAKVDGLRGKGIKNNYTGLSIEETTEAEPPTMKPKDWFWAKITDQTSSNGQWRFAWARARILTTGFDLVTNGETGSLSDGYALNTYNDSLRLTGDPVYVRMWIDLDENNNKVYVFEKESGIKFLKYNTGTSNGSLDAGYKHNDGNGDDWEEVIGFDPCPQQP